MLTYVEFIETRTGIYVYLV